VNGGDGFWNGEDGGILVWWLECRGAMPKCRTVDGTIAPFGTALVENASTTTMKPFLLNLFECPIKSPKQNSRRITCILKIMPLLQFMDISTDCLDGHLMSLLSDENRPHIIVDVPFVKGGKDFSVLYQNATSGSFGWIDIANIDGRFLSIYVVPLSPDFG
jgi:hypothetical protein